MTSNLPIYQICDQKFQPIKLWLLTMVIFWLHNKCFASSLYTRDGMSDYDIRTISTRYQQRMHSA